MGKLVVSIAAGVPIATLEASLPAKARVVRTMPNTPCLVGEAAVGLARGTRATDADADIAEALFTGTARRGAGRGRGVLSSTRVEAHSPNTIQSIEV